MPSPIGLTSLLLFDREYARRGGERMGPGPRIDATRGLLAANGSALPIAILGHLDVVERSEVCRSRPAALDSREAGQMGFFPALPVSGEAGLATPFARAARQTPGHRLRRALRSEEGSGVASTGRGERPPNRAEQGAVPSALLTGEAGKRHVCPVVGGNQVHRVGRYGGGRTEVATGREIGETQGSSGRPLTSKSSLE